MLDLGASPGGWSQYVSEKIGSKGIIVAVDILPMDEIENVKFIKGDFTENAIYQQCLEVLNNQRIDLVISDMAPNLSGIKVKDQAYSLYLAELASRAITASASACGSCGGQRKTLSPSTKADSTVAP